MEESPAMGWEECDGGAPDLGADLGWGDEDAADAPHKIGYSTRSGRARSHSFYEDDDDLAADLDAAVSGVPRNSSSGGRGRSDSTEGSGGDGGPAERGPRAGALNANEMAALNAGLHAYQLPLRRNRSESSDVDEESEADDDPGSPDDLGSHSTDFEDDELGGAGSSSGGDGLSPQPAGSPTYPALSAPPRPPGSFASNPGIAGRPGLGEFRDGFPGAALDDAAARPPPAAPNPGAPRLSIPRSTVGAGGFGIGAGAYGHVRRQSPSNARKIKILMLGDTGVGKSSLINRFTEDTFNPSLVGTVGVDFKMKRVQIDGEDVLLQVWDTAGQERFHKITRAYYRGSHAIVIVYDLSNPSTLENIEYWMRNIQENAGQTVKTCLVGNKMDLRDELAAPDGDAGGGGGGGGSGDGYEDMVAPDDGKRIADQFGIQFFEASAKTGIGVEEAYLSVARGANDFLRRAAKPATPVKGSSRKLSVGRGRSKGRAAAAAKAVAAPSSKDRSRDRTFSGDTSDSGSATPGAAAGAAMEASGSAPAARAAATAGAGGGAAAAAPAAKGKKDKKNGCKVS